MSVARLSRDRKRQLGQFFTPSSTAEGIVRRLTLLPTHRILEPSFGEGAFIFQILDALAENMSVADLTAWSQHHLFGCEIDKKAFATFTDKWLKTGRGPVPAGLEHGDFFRWMPPRAERAAATNRQQYFSASLETFDLVIGNPPFGGSIDPAIQDELDGIFGMRDSRKIKKETYAFFIVKCVDLLRPGGKLVIICSDTILTIPTMTGLRAWLQDRCTVDISHVPGSFSDTNQDMVLITACKRSMESRRVTVFGNDLSLDEIDSTPNRSWKVNSELARYFTGVHVGDKMIASSGMTIGNNDLFLRRIVEGYIDEPYDFSFGQQRITVANELARARLGKVSPARLRQVAEQEARGDTEDVVVFTKRDTPLRVRLPHPDYRFYNKASSRIGYGEAEWVIFWRDDGNYVYTFKKTGNWYLHGVGGMKHFGREGLTWSLIAPRLYARYLPPGYILDSGAPCAFLRSGVQQNELFFILGWALTDLCTRILKDVLNHTRNIQSKDFERLPYPSWVSPQAKAEAIRRVQCLIEAAESGREPVFSDPEVTSLNDLYAWQTGFSYETPRKPRAVRQMVLFERGDAEPNQPLLGTSLSADPER
jgi:hypothetical protein